MSESRFSRRRVMQALMGGLLVPATVGRVRATEPRSPTLWVRTDSIRGYWHHQRTGDTRTATTQLRFPMGGIPGDAFQHADVTITIDPPSKTSFRHRYQDGDDLILRTRAGDVGHELVLTPDPQYPHPGLRPESTSAFTT